MESTSAAVQYGGQPAIQTMIVDVTQRKLIEQALQRSESLLRMTGQIARIGGWELEVETGKLIWTEEMYAIHEIGLDHEPTMTNGDRFYPPEAWCELGMLVQRAIEQGEPFDVELLLITAKGKRLWVQAIGQALRKDGKTVKVFGSFQDITERKQAEQLLKAALLEKETLLKEIHHRVKNNLTVVSSLLELQGRASQDERLKSAFQNSQQRIQAMTAIHEQLYKSDNLARIDMTRYVAELAEELHSAYAHGELSLQVHIQEVYLGIDQAIPCGLILNELLTNALKYAFPAGAAEASQEPVIAVSMQQEKDQITLRVSDNGVGLPEGFNIEASRSLGLKLVTRLTGQLHGELEVASEFGQGNRFYDCVSGAGITGSGGALHSIIVQPLTAGRSLVGGWHRRALQFIAIQLDCQFHELWQRRVEPGEGGPEIRVHAIELPQTTQSLDARLVEAA